jgi:hypothetical protein
MQLYDFDDEVMPEFGGPEVRAAYLRYPAYGHLLPHQVAAKLKERWQEKKARREERRRRATRRLLLRLLKGHDGRVSHDLAVTTYRDEIAHRLEPLYEAAELLGLVEVRLPDETPVWTLPELADGQAEKITQV